MVKTRIDLTDRKFGKLTVLKQIEDYISPKGKHEAKWLCQCECGGLIAALGNALKKGYTTSCGCSVVEHITEINHRRKKYNDYEVQEDYVIMYTSKNEPFYVDLSDFWKIKDIYWYKNKDGYIVSKINKKETRIHRFIMTPPNNMDVDHRGGEPTRNDNRRGNLRIVTSTDNSHNTPPTKRNTSGHKNVFWVKGRGKWRVALRCNGKHIHVGYFDDFLEACKAEELAENKYYGEYSYYNSLESYNKWMKEGVES